MKHRRRIVPALLCASFSVAAAAATAFAQTSSDHASCSGHPPAAAAPAHAGVNERGDHVMGFDHAKTTHHFGLTKTGGQVEISANRADDTESVAAIRGHLPHIAKMFSEGDFEAPMLIHDRVPPGVPTMKRHPGAVAWKYEETAAGGRVVATTRDPEMLSALHAFFAFQIEDHQTGDSLAVR